MPHAVAARLRADGDDHAALSVTPRRAARKRWYRNSCLRQHRAALYHATDITKVVTGREDAEGFHPDPDQDLRLSHDRPCHLRPQPQACDVQSGAGGPDVASAPSFSAISPTCWPSSTNCATVASCPSRAAMPPGARRSAQVIEARRGRLYQETWTLPNGRDLSRHRPARIPMARSRSCSRISPPRSC